MVLRGGGVDWCPPAPQNKCLHSSSWEAGAARSCYQPRLVFLSLSLSLLTSWSGLPGPMPFVFSVSPNWFCTYSFLVVVGVVGKDSYLLKFLVVPLERREAFCFSWTLRRGAEPGRQRRGGRVCRGEHPRLISCLPRARAVSPGSPGWESTFPPLLRQNSQPVLCPMVCPEGTYGGRASGWQVGRL